MEGRLGNAWRMTENEKKFIKTALLSEIRIDGRRPYEFRSINIKFGREDGSVEVQLGKTRVMGIVTSELVQPYRDRPNEGSLSIFTEFSPMADPSFEPGRPGESAVELGRVIDRGLRESRAVDTESLCVLSGRFVWAIRIDLHILDNCGNLVDAANIAALAALLSFRRPDCSLGGEDGQEVIVHPPEVRDPVPLIVHHLPIAISFGFFTDGSIVVIDPNYSEEAVMGGRMTTTVNANGDICAIQKAGGDGISRGVIMQCLRIATAKAAGITRQIKEAFEAYNNERALRKIKNHSSTVTHVKAEHIPSIGIVRDSPGNNLERAKLASGKGFTTQSSDEVQKKSVGVEGPAGSDGNTLKFMGGPSSWDPYSKGVDQEYLKASLASREMPVLRKKQDLPSAVQAVAAEPESLPEEEQHMSVETISGTNTSQAKTLKDAVKPKNKRKKKASSAAVEGGYVKI